MYTILFYNVFMHNVAIIALVIPWLDIIGYKICDHRHQNIELFCNKPKLKISNETTVLHISTYNGEVLVNSSSCS